MFEVIREVSVAVVVVAVVPGGMLYVAWRYLLPRIRKTYADSGQERTIRTLMRGCRRQVIR